jgi:hypothetical protein
MQLEDVKMCNECQHFYMQITYQYLLTKYFPAQMSVPLKFLQIVIVLIIPTPWICMYLPQ